MDTMGTNGKKPPHREWMEGLLCIAEWETFTRMGLRRRSRRYPGSALGGSGDPARGTSVQGSEERKAPAGRSLAGMMRGVACHYRNSALCGTGG